MTVMAKIYKSIIVHNVGDKQLNMVKKIIKDCEYACPLKILE